LDQPLEEINVTVSDVPSNLITKDEIEKLLPEKEAVIEESGIFECLQLIGSGVSQVARFLFPGELIALMRPNFQVLVCSHLPPPQTLKAKPNFYY